MMKKSMIGLAAAAALLATAAQASDYFHQISESPVVERPGHTGNMPAPGDKSVLRRFRDFVHVKVSTSGLDAGMPYTIWAVVFNNPQHCATSPCTLADQPVFAGHNPNVQGSLVHVTGGVVNMDGTGEFVGKVHVTRNGVATLAERRHGPGLLDARHADILLVVRRHGDPATPPANLSVVMDSITSFNGGCPDSSACEDQQVSMHVAGWDR